MAATPLPTRFAPAERAPAAELRRQADHFAADSLTCHLLDAVPGILLVLNAQRQIVYANHALPALLGLADRKAVLGLRPGEALGCVHAGAVQGECGTADPCRSCGAVLAILGGLAGWREMREYRVSCQRDGRTEALDLRVWATPLAFGGEPFTLFAVSDISDEKRRQALERIFFHDILNLLGSIRGFAELLRDYDPAEKQEIYALLHAAAQRVIEEIDAQRTLAEAESKELQVRPQTLRAREFLLQTVEVFRRHEAAEGRELALAPETPEIEIVTDRALLGRVLGNMIKNALEASVPGERVTVGCRGEAQRIVFSVHKSGGRPRMGGAADLPALLFHPGPRPGAGDLQHAPAQRIPEGRGLVHQPPRLGDNLFRRLPPAPFLTLVLRSSVRLS
jgi:nitrogen-specific signal transduction histidine kinase